MGNLACNVYTRMYKVYMLHLHVFIQNVGFFRIPKNHTHAYCGAINQNNSSKFSLSIALSDSHNYHVLMAIEFLGSVADVNKFYIADFGGDNNLELISSF